MKLFNTVGVTAAVRNVFADNSLTDSAQYYSNQHGNDDGQDDSRYTPLSNKDNSSSTIHDQLTYKNEKQSTDFHRSYDHPNNC